MKHIIAVRECPADIGTTRKAILFAIASRIGDMGFAWPKEESIAKDSGASLRSVKRHLIYLRREAFLVRSREAGIRSWCYRLGPAIYGPVRVPDQSSEPCQPGPTLVPIRSAKGANLSPEGRREGIHYKAKGRQRGARPGIEYSIAPLPAIEDYGDINVHDPILAAMAISQERAKTGWGHWVKRLRQAREIYGIAKGDAIFRECLHELFGLSKEPHKSTLGAIFNKLLADRLGPLKTGLRNVA